MRTRLEELVRLLPPRPRFFILFKPRPDMADKLSKETAAGADVNVLDDIDPHEKHEAATMDPERRKQVERSLKRKLDARCSLFVFIYIMNYLDRNNIAAARLGGLQDDLGINNTQYATCLSIRTSILLTPYSHRTR